MNSINISTLTNCLVRKAKHAPSAVYGKKTDYEITNKSFIGFKLDSGKHNIEIKYTSPWLKEGEIMSIIGLCLLLVTIGYKRSKNK